MFDQLHKQFAGLLKRDDDPLGTITPDQLKVVLKSIEGKYNSLRDENRRIKVLVEEQRIALADMEKARSEIRNQHEAATSPKEEEVADTQLEQGLAPFTAANHDDCHSAIAVLEASLDRARDEITALRQENDELCSLRESAADVEASLDRARDEITALRQENDELCSLRESAREVAQRVEEADAERVALRTRVEEADAQRVALRARVEEALEERRLMTCDLEAVRRHRDSLVAQRSSLEAQRNRLAEELGALSNVKDAQEVAEASINKLESALGQKREVEARHEAALAAQRVAESQKTDLESRLALTEAALRSLKADAEKIRRERDRLLARLGEITAERDDLRALVGPLQAAQANLVDRTDRLATSQDQITTKLSDLSLRTRRSETPADESDVNDLRRALAAISEQVERYAGAQPQSRPSNSRVLTPLGTQNKDHDRGWTSSESPREARLDPVRKLDWLLGRSS